MEPGFRPMEPSNLRYNPNLLPFVRWFNVWGNLRYYNLCRFNSLFTILLHSPDRVRPIWALGRGHADGRIARAQSEFFQSGYNWVVLNWYTWVNVLHLTYIVASPKNENLSGMRPIFVVWEKKSFWHIFSYYLEQACAWGDWPQESHTAPRDVGKADKQW